jgi:hypothetical protein
MSRARMLLHGEDLAGKKKLEEVIKTYPRQLSYQVSNDPW